MSITMRGWNGSEEKKVHPKVSVVIPCYNHGHYLRSALESVLAQKYSNLEVVVVDDGSTDNTPNVSTEFPHVNYVRQSRRGSSGARNTGIEQSNGDLIAFLDADDFWLPEKLHAQVNCLTANPDLGLVYSPIRILDNQSGRVHWRMKRCPRRLTFEKLLMSNPISMSTVLVRRSCFEKVGVFNPGLGMGQDWEMWLRIVSFFNVCVVRKALAVYRQYRSPLDRDFHAVLENQLVVIKKIWEFTERREVKVALNIFDQAIALRKIQTSLNCLQAENSALFEALFLQGMKDAEMVPAHIWLRLMGISLLNTGRRVVPLSSIFRKALGYYILRLPYTDEDRALGLLGSELGNRLKKSSKLEKACQKEANVIGKSVSASFH